MRRLIYSASLASIHAMPETETSSRLRIGVHLGDILVEDGRHLRRWRQCCGEAREHRGAWRHCAFEAGT